MFAALFLLVVVVVYRILSGFLGSGDFQWAHNFAPVAAVALCGAVYLPRRMAAVLPLVMMLISDAVLDAAVYHRDFFTAESLLRYVALGLIAGLGFSLRGRANLLRLLLGSAAGSIIFYVITNLGAWQSEPGYTKDLAGLFQAMTTGLPGYPSTLWFYRYTLISDLFFTLLFAACMAIPFKGEAQPNEAAGELA